MTSHGQALSLGALFHHLRDGLADRGLVRVTLEFRLESDTSEGESGDGARLFRRRGFRATLDYEDEVLRHAHLVSTGMSPRPLAEVHISLQGGRYVYSRDGYHGGLLIDTPRLYDVYSFESRLSRIAVRDVVLEEDPQPDGSARNILRVDIDDDAFRRLIHLFGDDVEAANEVLEQEDRSLVMTAGIDVGIHYQWSSRTAQETAGAGGEGGRPLSQHNSRVTIRLEPLATITAGPLHLDGNLPELGGIDDVWTLRRQPASDPPTLIGRRL